jgi:hypothetical protein
MLELSFESNRIVQCFANFAEYNVFTSNYLHLLILCSPLSGGNFFKLPNLWKFGKFSLIG